MRANKTKQKLADGGVAFGAIISENAPGLVELFGLLRYDFVFIDCEHGPMDLNQVEGMVRAAEAFDITPIVRVADHAPSTLLRYLDRGVQGVIVPHVNTAEEARAVARAARYYPQGNRGMAGGRAHDYGVGVSLRDSSRWINDNLLVIPMIEEVEAVTNLDEIVKVEGVDVLHCAASDLGQSMGNAERSEVRRVMLDVVRRVRAAGKAAGVGGNSASDAAGVAELVRAGANFVTIAATGLLRLGSDQFRAAVDAQLAH